jgi:S-DNA-T family DNA segregation ATPase FtsK/SpoIIIE
MSMFDPMFLGIDEFGQSVYIHMAYRNLLAAGEPGGGKSGLLNIAAAHAALSTNTRLVLFDGKLVELGQWEDSADEFVGPDIEHAIRVLRHLQTLMNNRYAWLRAHQRRKVVAEDLLSIIVALFDEIAYYSATVGTKQQQEEFAALLRDLVARGRAAGIIVVAATQRPSFDIIPTSLRDIFGYRAAFRCTTPNSSNIILGHGWAEQGYNATDIAPTNQGAAYLLAEGGVPRRIKVAYLSDAQIQAIADYAAWIRRPSGLTAPATPATIRRFDWETAA